ncbi:RHS repeat domain-containing protein [Pedobacter caeni]|uniref:YD repeat-containing protein n=1 Tax=Pedobacter caeni TaxID=288992 RepID=A0A1M4WFC2_9SPHI|nr:hypothetical protein [Pedobacter caeni]SHE79926.1 hypothetical protein SAMN04488522_1011250 [Pedobacter caeni]
MKFPQFIKYGSLLMFSLFVFSVHAQEAPIDINQNLDNYLIRRTYEDTANFKSKDIYAVRYYKSDKKGKLPALVSYTEYLPDGRIRTKKYKNTQGNIIESYHYDQYFDKLLLTERNENNKLSQYNHLFYDKKGNLTEEFGYKIYGGKRFEYESYSKYKIQYLKNETKVEIIDYDNDFRISPGKKYSFFPGYITKYSPQYQYKRETFKPINGTLRRTEAKGFIFDDRNVDYTYDKNGFITSEIWYKPASQLENKTEYFYSADYRERIEQQYHMRGTEKSLKTTRKYDELGNLVFDQSIEYTGNPTGIDHYEYRYDERGNWTEKTSYYQPCEHKVLGKKMFISFERREIQYYKPEQHPATLSLRTFPKKARDLKPKIPELAAEKEKTRKKSDPEQ